MRVGYFVIRVRVGYILTVWSEGWVYCDSGVRVGYFMTVWGEGWVFCDSME